MRKGENDEIKKIILQNSVESLACAFDVIHVQ
jgi:hypothetical protein